MNGNNNAEIATEDSPLVTSASLSVNNSTNGSENGSAASTTESTRLWDELDQPWPSTFERAVGLLASPGVSREKVELYTHSPKPGSTPLALQRRRNLSRGFYSPEPTAAVLAQRRAQDFLHDYYDGDDLESSTRKERHDSDRLHDKKETMLKNKSLDFGLRIQSTQSQLADKAQKAKEYRQQVLKQQQQRDSNKTSTVITDSEREGMLRSPGYAKEVQSLRYKKEQKKAADAHGASGSAAGSANVLQSAFNLANILMGVGLLGLPFGFKMAGYWGGFTCVLVFGIITWRTSILIGRELNGDPRPASSFTDNPFKSPYPPGSAHGRLLPPITGFPDIARRAFGETGCVVLSILLYFELFSCVCIFFVTIGDHLHSIFPGITLEIHTILAASVSLIPTIFLHTPALLSYFSMVGTFATIAVVGTVVGAALLQGSMVDTMMAAQEAATGVASTEPPYQAWGNVNGIIMCLGLVAYCFSGHAIVPSIYTSMKEPQRFEEMVTITFIIVMLVCFAVAVSGYYMFGTTVADQVTLSLEAGFQAGGLMDILIWLMILTAFSKTTLTIFPLALGMEEIFAPYFTSEKAVDFMAGIIKLVITALALLVSLYVPSFSFLCALTGMICTMTVSVIFPAAAHWKIFYNHITWWEHAANAVFVVLGLVMAVVGTVQTV